MSDSQSLRDKFLSHVRDNIRGPSAGNIEDFSQLTKKERLELLEFAGYFAQIYCQSLEYEKYKELLDIVCSLAQFKYQEYLEDRDLSIAFHVVNDKSSIRIVDRENFKPLIDKVLAIARKKITGST